MSIPRKVAYNVIVSSGAKVASTFLALLGIGMITRYLGQDGFGMYTTALAFLSLFSALGDWGIYQTATRKISRPGASEKEIISNAMGLRLVVSSAVIFVTPLIISFLPYSTELKIAIFIIVFSYAASSIYQTMNGLFQKRLLMDRVTIAEFFGKIVQVSMVFIGVKYDLGFYFIISSILAAMVFDLFAVMLLSRKFIKFRPRFNLSYWKPFIRQSFPIGLSVAVTFIYFKADTILLSLMRTQQEVGIYGAAYKVIENISFFPSMVVGLTMPMFAFHIFNNNEKFKSIVNKNFKVFMILVVPLLVGTLFLAEGIISVIAGPEFAPSADLLRIIMFALAFIFFGHLFNNILIVANLQKQLFWSLLVCAIFNVTLNLIFIPKYSYYATAYVSVATELLVVLITGFVIFKNLKFIPVSTKLFRIIASGLIMSAFLWFLKDQHFAIKLLASPIVYFLSLVAFKVISKDEILSLIKKEDIAKKNS